jgi:bifunctional DNA-binding transcriptional regulator/antitoxin component of YhaV-PrlF toxin-antitoxin module
MGTKDNVVAHEFRALLQGVEDSSATFVLVPTRVMREFGGRTRVPVRIAINGVEHRTTICNMGTGPAIGIPATIRRTAGIARGDRIAVALEVDQQERTVDLPRDFAKAMTPAERRVYDTLAYSHRKEYVFWIEDAKKPETRIRRIEQARAKLRDRAR